MWAREEISLCSTPHLFKYRPALPHRPTIMFSRVLAVSNNGVPTADFWLLTPDAGTHQNAKEKRVRVGTGGHRVLV